VPEAAIAIENVSKTFGQTRAVRDLTLEVPCGSLCGFLGPNGAGKSTTIRMIMSIIYPDTGRINLLGSDALHNKDKIGYLPEERGLYRKMKVADYLEYIARLKGVDVAEARRRVTTWLERFDLPGVARKKCEELSKGMQQKVQFLAAIIHDPALIILDEPFSGLDPVNSQLLIDFIREMNRAGKTVIFSTHVLHQAEVLCDRIFLINKGIKLLDATLEEIDARFDPRTIVAEPLDGVARFEDVPGVARIAPLPHSQKFEIEVESGHDRQDVMTEIVGRIPVRSIELRRLSLEEVFVQMVARDAGAEAAQVAREELKHA
jgi:ABC-2 type transport system ATP-binding protein